MLKTTLLMFGMALMLAAQGKLTEPEKLALARAEAAAAKAGAEVAGFANYANNEIRRLEAAAKQKTEARDALVAELKKKHSIGAACTFDENQKPKCPEVKK